MKNASVPFADCFSDGADDYARYRPGYPDGLFGRLAELAPGRSLAWDCATGNGQAAVALTGTFERVIATDASADQLACAVPHPRIEYRHELAERTSLADGSADLVTVAAALHWLDQPAFYREVARVLRPGGVVAAWTYGMRFEGAPAIDAIVADYTRTVIAPYVLPQLQHVITRYRQIGFPFVEIELQPLEIVVEWNLAQLVGMLNTWSAAVAFRSRHGHPATDLIRDELARAWLCDGAIDTPRHLRLPLYTRVGRVG